MRRVQFVALVAAVLAALLPAAASAQDISRACPRAAEVTYEHLLGMWRAEFEGLAQGATVLLERHPEHVGVRGAINRGGDRWEVSGEVGGGEFLMEESENGISISATWDGDVVEGTCGREIRGGWRLERDKVLRPFVLRKL